MYNMSSITPVQSSSACFSNQSNQSLSSEFTIESDNKKAAFQKRYREVMDSMMRTMLLDALNRFKIKYHSAFKE